MAITSADIREWSKVNFDALGFPEPTGYEDDGLERMVNRAEEYVLEVTGRRETGVPAEFTHSYDEAVQRRVEQLAFKAQEDEAETAADFETIASFGAGSYNESRRSMEEQRKAKMINPWPHLNDLLWRMSTDERRDEWEDYWASADGVSPGFEITEMDWENSGIAGPDFGYYWPGV